MKTDKPIRLMIPKYKCKICLKTIDRRGLENHVTTHGKKSAKGHYRIYYEIKELLI